MDTTTCAVYTLGVVFLNLSVTYAENDFIIKSLMERMEQFEKQGIIQQNRIDQQDRLLGLYLKQLTDQAHRIQHLEKQLFGQEAQSTMPKSNTKAIDQSKYMDNETLHTEGHEFDTPQAAVISSDESSSPKTEKLDRSHDLLGGMGHGDGQTKAVRRLVLSNTEGAVAFHATADKGTVPVGLNQHIIFEDVHVDLGNGFHELQGLFIAPKSGIYLFSLSIMTQVGEGDIVAQITKNGAALAKAYANGNSSVPDQGSVTVVTQVTAGDEVWVSSIDRHVASDYGDLLTSFMGILLIEI